MLVEQLRKKYIESGDIERLLEGTGIDVLKDFIENWDSVLEFNRNFYAGGEPKTVLCGLNPGRLGAGKTGIPFTDFKSLSNLIPNIKREDTERSAQFFHEVITHFGAYDFYRSFYVTNVSWLGYVKERKNINFYDLPLPAKDKVMSLFSYEMSHIQPTTIISMSSSAKEAVALTIGSSARTDIELPHPNYCAFPKNKEKCKQRYIETLEPFIRKA